MMHISIMHNIQMLKISGVLSHIFINSKLKVGDYSVTTDLALISYRDFKTNHNPQCPRNISSMCMA